MKTARDAAKNGIEMGGAGDPCPEVNGCRINGQNSCERARMLPEFDP
jgi:hypothetical protein